jgi:hypothetical protein
VVLCRDNTIWGRLGFNTTGIIVALNNKFRQKFWTSAFNNLENLRDEKGE